MPFFLVNSCLGSDTGVDASADAHAQHFLKEEFASIGNFNLADQSRTTNALLVHNSTRVRPSHGSISKKLHHFTATHKHASKR